ncbi:monooxygenase [Pseudoclavibacter endophyticus]|uniref:LLM class flavin-dependent oxidoreductase n=1 Tax=Pseudoclavibacter endophyticus TaxID=1778590 RepID=A0A6H9WGY4_9MICO|nr:LLM class flavin-dependent oxidoreductase [Pseudoclavibacter endophyticus]KAB1646861.1 LLM class flavin-dependent oxidoreductase [Pseudoclavibacter endophyticus]GGA74936.1 monooxygenase [Pseudoclavibacter endophyticus]
MPEPGSPLAKLSFLTIVPFDRDDPAGGIERGLRLFELGESLGFDGGWIRTRHLQYGVSSPAAFLSAVSQHTSRLELGTAVIPLGWENPLRLAEDLATVDLLSGGRLQIGVSVGTPMHYGRVKNALYGELADEQDFSYARVDKFVSLLRGDAVTSESGKEGVVEEYSERVEPHSAGLSERVLYGSASRRSAEWAGARGLGLLQSNITMAEGTMDFAEAQREQIEAYRKAVPPGSSGRVAMGHVVLPIDSATPRQRKRYEEYVRARTPRTASPQEFPGGRMALIKRDRLGTAEEIVAGLYEDVAFRQVDEFFIELPFSFPQADTEQLLHDLATEVGPRLGWTPANAR